MNLEVRHLKLVAAVAELRSLTKAGERLHLTQSALSYQLKDIETKLGTPIFLRRNKRMVLTPAGDRLLASAHDVLERLQQAEHAIQHMAVAREGLLRIATECHTGYHWLPCLLKQFHRTYPRVEVRINAEATPRPLHTLLNGELDLALMTSAPKDRRLVVRPLFRDEFYAIVNPDHPLASCPYLEAQDFTHEDVLIYGAKEDTSLFRQMLNPAGVVPRGVQQMQLTEAIIEMVKAGLAVSVLSRWAAQPYLDEGVVCGVPLTRHGLYRSWSAVVPKSLARTPYVLEFIQLLASSSIPARCPSNVQAYRRTRPTRRRSRSRVTRRRG